MKMRTLSRSMHQTSREKPLEAAYSYVPERLLSQTAYFRFGHRVRSDNRPLPGSEIHWPLSGVESWKVTVASVPGPA